MCKLESARRENGSVPLVVTQPIFLEESTAVATASFGTEPFPLVRVAENGDKRRRGRGRVTRWTSQVESMGEISRTLCFYSSVHQSCNEGQSGEVFCLALLEFYLDWVERVWPTYEEGSAMIPR